MGEGDKNVEEAILNAAEQVFLEKGYAGAKTTEIAALAGVNHAMLHYYFRTKENIFNKVFEKKVHILSDSFIHVFEGDFPFLEKIRLAVGTHFDFISAHPRLPVFIIQEIINNEERRMKLKAVMNEKSMGLFLNLQKAIEEEISKGNIRKTTALDLILNIVSLNAFSVIFSCIAEHEEAMAGGVQHFLEQRKENNIYLIIKSLEV